MAGHHLVSLTDPDLNPLACAEQFADPDPSKALSPEELLRRARIILATELGKDPLLRSEVRNIVKTTALLTVEPTERGIQNIDEVHPFYVRRPIHTFAKRNLPLLVLQIPLEQAHGCNAAFTTVPPHSAGREGPPHYGRHHNTP